MPAGLRNKRHAVWSAAMASAWRATLLVLTVLLAVSRGEFEGAR